MANNSYVFYESFLDAIELLPENKQLEAYQAISRYAIRGEEPRIDGMPLIVFTMAKPNIDANEKKRNGGVLGGRPPKNPKDAQEIKPPQPEDNELDTIGIDDNNHRIHAEEPMGESNVNGNGNNNANEAENETNNVPYKKIEMYYCDICTALPKIRGMSSERKKHVAARYKQYGLDTMLEVFALANKSEFLCNGSETWPGANFDWLMNDANFCKILEGKYNSTNKPKAIRDEPQASVWNYKENTPDEQAYLDSFG